MATHRRTWLVPSVMQSKFAAMELLDSNKLTNPREAISWAKIKPLPSSVVGGHDGHVPVGQLRTGGQGISMFYVWFCFSLHKNSSKCIDVIFDSFCWYTCFFWKIAFLHISSMSLMFFFARGFSLQSKETETVLVFLLLWSPNENRELNFHLREDNLIWSWSSNWDTLAGKILQRLIWYCPINYRVSYIPGWLFGISSNNSRLHSWSMLGVVGSKGLSQCRLITVATVVAALQWMRLNLMQGH